MLLGLIRETPFDRTREKVRNILFMIIINFLLRKTLIFEITWYRTKVIVYRVREEGLTASSHVLTKAQGLFRGETSKTMGTEKLTIFLLIQRTNNTLACLTVLCHVLKHITDTLFTFETLDLGATIMLGPTLTNNLTSQRTAKKYRMKVHSVSRGQATLPSSFTVSKLKNKQVIELQFPTLQRGMFTQTVNKPTNEKIRLFNRLSINFRLKSKRTEIAILRTIMPSLVNLMRTKKPILLPFLKAIHTMTTRNNYSVVRLGRKTTNTDSILLRKSLVVRIDYTQR